MSSYVMLNLKNLYMIDFIRENVYIWFLIAGQKKPFKQRDSRIYASFFIFISYFIPDIFFFWFLIAWYEKAISPTKSESWLFILWCIYALNNMLDFLSENLEVIEVAFNCLFMFHLTPIAPIKECHICLFLCQKYTAYV